ncbi:MAG TPA: hypothetical protein PKW64_02455 [Segatella copri]|nr:hypothetical protein [Segatella copri]
MIDQAIVIGMNSDIAIILDSYRWGDTEGTRYRMTQIKRIILLTQDYIIVLSVHFFDNFGYIRLSVTNIGSNLELKDGTIATFRRGLFGSDAIRYDVIVAFASGNMECFAGKVAAVYPQYHRYAEGNRNRAFPYGIKISIGYSIQK